MNIFLYVATVLIWGSTWFAIEFQLGEAPILVSLVYRWGLAAALMWGFCLIRRLPMQFSLRNHGFIALMAIFNFGLNYLLVYWAQVYLTSAMTSIAFTTMVLMNIVNMRIFFGQRISLITCFGAVIGVAGIMSLFWLDIRDVNIDGESLKGLGLALSGALLASLGNMVSIRNSRLNLPVLQVNAWGMMYGALLMALVAMAFDTSFMLPTKIDYWVSLIYLALFGSVLAFACYFTLLKRIDPNKASYASVLYPGVAVILSTLFEGFEWTSYVVLGFVLVAIGNVIVITPRAVLVRTLSYLRLR
jgi:drug/metabolite transporter (DMT)-like permease